MKNSLFIFTPCLPHCFLPVHWDQTMIIVCHSLGSRPILVQELFTLMLRIFGTTSRCLSVKPFQLLPLRNIWRYISLTWPFPHRYCHSPWPVDVTELFPRFCCWTLIWLSHHWAWLRRGYWRYRSLIDWFEDTSLWLGLSPLDTSTHNSPLIPQNCIIDFAVEHWFGCHATEPGFSRDIDAVESCLSELHRNWPVPWSQWKTWTFINNSHPSNEWPPLFCDHFDLVEGEYCMCTKFHNLLYLANIVNVG